MKKKPDEKRIRTRRSKEERVAKDLDEKASAKRIRHLRRKGYAVRCEHTGTEIIVYKKKKMYHL